MFETYCEVEWINGKMSLLRSRFFLVLLKRTRLEVRHPRKWIDSVRSLVLARGLTSTDQAEILAVAMEEWRRLIRGEAMGHWVPCPTMHPNRVGIEI